jgi:peptide/nickel transport system substrate-binding protein
MASIRRLLTTVTCAAALAAAFAFPAGLAWAGGTFRLGTNIAPVTFDPIKTTANGDIWVLNNMNAFLVRANHEATGIVPDLAESWEISPDGKTYTFHLRDAKFSDGSPVKASDAAFSLLRVRDDKESAWGYLYSTLDTAVAKDDHTLVLTLKDPTAPLLASLAMFAASVLPEKVVKELGNGFAEHPVGAGAFRLKEWRREEVVKLERNPNYWEAGLPKLDAVEWYKIVDDNTRILKVQAGELDGAIFIPFNRLTELKSDPKLDVHLDLSTREDHLDLNHENKWLAKKNVREALAMAIDRDAIIKVVTFGFGTPANSYLPTGMLYYNPDNKVAPYDPEQAKKLLAAEGASDITLELVHEAGDKTNEQLAVLLQAQLAKVGVTLKLRTVDPAQTIPTLADGTYEISPVYWTNDVIDPDEKTTFALGMDSNNNFWSRYKNKDAADLVAKARTESDDAKRRAIYYQLQKIAADDVVMIDLYNSPYRNISRKGVTGFYQNPLGRFELETVEVK